MKHIMPSLENLLKELQKRLAVVERKLDVLLERKDKTASPQPAVAHAPAYQELREQIFQPEISLPASRRYVPASISSLPDHLKKTALTISTMGQATAEEVAAETGRSRAAESDYLNQLASQGILDKERRGKQVVFKVFSVFTICPYCGTRVPMNAKFCPSCSASLT